jgi:asparagine synthase (glutamine-hydrolysing)
LRFEDSEFDEGKYQKEMSNRLGTVHNDVCVSNRDIGEIFPEVIKHAERPILRTAPAPLFLLSRLVRDSGYKVVVTGEGADEVLAGYDIFREAKVRRFIAENPESPEVEYYLNQLYPWMKRAPGKVPAFARSFFSKNLDLNDRGFSHRPRWDSSSAIMQMFTGDFKEQVCPGAIKNNLFSQIPEEFGNWSPLNRDQWIEYKTLLSGYILSAQGDRMLMANSVEGRFPFLDTNLVDFANTLPDAIKLKDLNEKYILKKAFSSFIPDSIINRPKQPYRAPDAQSFFFNDTDLDWMEEIHDESFIREAGIFNPLSVTKLFEKCSKKSEIKMSNTDNMRVVGILSAMLCYKFIIKRENISQRNYNQPMLVIDRS